MKLCPRRFLQLAPVIGLILAAIVLPQPLGLPLSRAGEPSPQDVVEQAWQRAQEIGQYSFHSEIVQTTYPAPALANVGRGSRQDTLYLEGRADLAGRTLDMALWKDGGNIVNGRDGLEVRIEGDRAYGRSLGGTWQQIDDFSSAFAPGGDLLSYLAGVKNVERGASSPPRDLAPGYTRYRFDFDGPAFAYHMRDQLETFLRERGELPFGLTLDAPRQYLQTTGRGEIWIDEQGLPLRLVILLEYPEQGNGDRVTADITTDFSDFPPEVQAVSPPQRLLGSILSRLTHDGPQAAARVGVLLATLVLLALLVVGRRSKRVYVAFTYLLIFSLVFVPLLQAQKVAAFFERQADRQAEYGQRQQQQEADQALLATLNAWDPQRDPLAGADSLPVAPIPAPAAGRGPLAAPLVGPPEESLDSDADGLADELELWLGTDPAMPDTDGDGLGDGIEVLRLETDPTSPDTDGDQISDHGEVQGFDFDNQHWYLNPANPDTNGDGLLDGAECPELQDLAHAPEAANCDLDGDGLPNPFDGDDEGDGVPDKVDLSPHTSLNQLGQRYVGDDPFDREHPFSLKVTGLEGGYPVFVDLQLRPVNATHLAYAGNVLDWPGGDTDGQIQHVKDTTFATTDDPASRDRIDPRSVNGDLRLIPMLEVEIPAVWGDSVPLALANPLVTVTTVGDITATVRMEQQGADVRVRFSMPAGQAGYAGIYPGSCPAAPVIASPPWYVWDGQERTIEDADLVELADGSRHLAIFYGEDGTPMSCGNLPNVANGPYRDKMIDLAPLQPYGISVRDKDENGALLLYVPLNVLPDDTGGGKAAFSARLLYWPGAADDWDNEHRMRVVWVVQALTDACDWSSFQPSAQALTDTVQYSEELEAWCVDPAHRTADLPQVVHAYYEEWYLTGLAVREDHQVDVAIAWQVPEPGQDNNAQDLLWHFARGLTAVFAAGRDCEDELENGIDYDPDNYVCQSDGKRDLVVAARNGGNTTIADRFGVGSTADITATWGITPGLLGIKTISYPHQDYLVWIAMKETREILEQNFAAYQDDTYPTLLFAHEETFRDANLGDGVQWTTGTLSVDIPQSALHTAAIVNWAPYRYNDDLGPGGEPVGWEAYPMAEYWDWMEVTYKAAFQALYPGDPDDRILGRTVVARGLYLSLYGGVNNMVAQGNLLEWAPPWVSGMGDGDDSDLGLAKEIQGILINTYWVAGDFVNDFVRNAVKGFASTMVNYRLFSETVSATERGWAFLDALGAGARGVKGVWSRAFNPNNIFGKVGRLSKVGIGAGLGLMFVVAGAAVALSIYGAAQAASAVTAVGYVLTGLNSVILLKGLVSEVSKLARKGTSVTLKGILNLKAFKQNASSKLALIGLIVGVVLTWAIFVLIAVLSHPSRAQLGAAVAEAVASTVVQVLMFAIGCIPLVGQIIICVIYLLDTLVALICNLILSEDQRESVYGQWFCGGLQGIVQKALAESIYIYTSMVDLSAEDRLQISGLDTNDLLYPEIGLAVGNRVLLGVWFTNTIDLVDLSSSRVRQFLFQYSDGALRSSTFDYRLQVAETPFHEGLSRGTMQGEWQYVDGTPPLWDPFHIFQLPEPVFIASSVRSVDGIPLTEAGINRSLGVYLSEAWATPVQECVLGICYRITERDTRHYYLGDGIHLDIFPATLDDFYSLVPKEGGYALGWGQAGDVTFPRLRDADGDGLAFGADPDDSHWDSDADGLSDWFELQVGSSLRYHDSDGDGLRDDEEARLGTDPTRPDTDGDGLNDGAEVYHQDLLDQNQNGDYSEWVGGWAVVYAVQEDGTPLTTWVASDPLTSDGDGDGLTDAQEHLYGFHPNVPSVANVLSLRSDIQEIAAGGVLTSSDGVVAAGSSFYYSATVRNELESRYAQGLLNSTFPPAMDGQAVLPQTFILEPGQGQVILGDVPVAGNAASGAYTLTQVAGAKIADWAELASHAQLWLPLDDPLGSDRSGNVPPHDGVCQGSCQQVPGKLGGAMELSGGSYMASALDPSETDFAISLWFSTIVAHGALFSVDDPSGTQIYLQAGWVCATVYIGGPETICTPETYHDGHWHHLVHTFGSTAGTQKLYVDGVEQVRGTRVGPAVANQSGIRLGRVDLPGIPDWQGLIDDVRVYGQGLRPVGVQALFLEPVFDMTFDEDSGWLDHSVFQNDASCLSGECPDRRRHGISGWAALFGGRNVLRVGPDPSLQLGRGANDTQFTIAGWVYVEPLEDSYGGWGVTAYGLLGKNSGEANGYPSLQRVSYYDVNGWHDEVWFGFGTGSEWVGPYQSPSVLTQGRWNHVALTFDGSSGALKLYVDGQIVDEDMTTFPGQVPAPTQEFTIGRTSEIGRVTIGDITVTSQNDEGVDPTSELCMAFNGQEIVNLQVEDRPEEPYPVDVTVEFPGLGRLVIWEDDRGVTCGEAPDLDDDNPFTNDDDLIDILDFSTGSHGWSRTQFLRGAVNGSFPLTYANNSVPSQDRIDEVRIYQRVLGADEIADLYEAGTTAVHLSLDDPPGETAFDNAVDPTFQGTCSGSACPTAGVSGRVNQAAWFDAAQQDRIVLPDLGDFEQTTVAAWVYRSGATAERETIVSYKEHASCGFVLSLNENGSQHYPRFSVRVDGQWEHVVEASPQTVPLNTWVHLAGTYDGKILRLYRNGEQVGSTLASGTMSQCTASSAIGSRSSADMHFFPGRIDDVYIFRSALPWERVWALHQRAPLFQLHLDDAHGTTQFTDSSGNGNHGTCGGNGCPTAGPEVKGRIGQAVEFDGQDDRIVVADIPALRLEHSFSMGAWVMPTAVKDTSQELIVRGFYDAATPLFLSYRLMLPAGSLQPVFTGASCSPETNWATVTSTVPLVLNAWNHVMGTYDEQAQVLKLYVNGSEQGRWTHPYPYVCTFQGPGPEIGGKAGYNSFAGRLDEVTLYDLPLSDRQIYEIYRYQVNWVEDWQLHDVTVDAEDPTTVLSTTATYLPAHDRQMLIVAQDLTSRIVSATLGTRRYDAGQITWTTAPRCPDSWGDNAWCPTFAPDGEGRYTLNSRVADQVGHTALYTTTVYVDDAAPAINFAFAPDARIDATWSPLEETVWTVHLSGTVADPGLPDGSAGSGVRPDGVWVTLHAADGTLAGQNRQPAVLNGTTWQVDYVLDKAQPTGPYTVTVEAADEVTRLPELPPEQLARHTASAARPIQVDATAAAAYLDLADIPPAGIPHGTVLDGGVSERPVALSVAWWAPAGWRPGLTVICAGQTLHAIPAGLYSSRALTYTWEALAHRGAACQVSATDNTTAGVVRVCGQQVASWASGSAGVAFTADAPACGPTTAVAGVAQAEVSFVPLLPGSPFYNATLPTDQLLHTPFEIMPIEDSGMLYFSDIATPGKNDPSGLGHTGRCYGQGCPFVGQPSPTGQAAWFDGADDYIDLGKSTLNQLTNNFTVMAWIKPDRVIGGAPTVQWIVGTFGIIPTADNPDGFGLGVRQDGLRFSTLGVQNYDTTLISLDPGIWYHVAAVMNPDNSVTFYLDGEAQETIPGSGPANADTDSPLLISIPGMVLPDLPFSGRMDDLRIFDRALGAAEIKTIYLDSDSQPVLALPFDEAWAVPGTQLAETSGWEQRAVLYKDGGTPNVANRAVLGRVGAQALEFDGSGDIVAVYPAKSLDLSGGQFTQAAWVYPAPEHDGSYPILSSAAYAPGDQQYPFIQIITRTHLLVGFGDGTTLNTFDSGSILTENAWNHVVATFDGTTYRIYVDGVERAATTAFEGKTPYPAGRFDLGRGRDVGDVSTCARVRFVSLTPHDLQYMYRLKWTGGVTSWFPTGDWPTPQVAVGINQVRYFCGTGEVALEVLYWDGTQFVIEPVGSPHTLDFTPGAGSHTFSGANGAATAAWEVTADPDRLLYFRGRLDDLRVYRRALPALEVQALYRSAWQTATLSAPGGEVSDWTVTVPEGLEGEYRIDLRGQDAAGHADNSGHTLNAWGGAVDTLAPRVVLTREIVGLKYRYTAVAQDFNLREQGFSSPCGAGVVTSRDYFQSPWYAALAGRSYTHTGKLYQLTASCEVEPTLAWRQEVGFEALSSARQVLADGAYAYLISDGRMQVIDVSDPVSPTTVGVYTATVDAWDLAISGGYAYVVDIGAEFTVVDLQDPTQPQWVGTAVAQGVQSLVVSGTHAYLASPIWGLMVFDVSVPMTPTEVGNYPGLWDNVDMAIAGDHVYALSSMDHLQIVDVSVPTNPTLAGEYTLTPSDYAAKAVAVSGSYAYVAGGYAGLRILDVTDPAAVNEVGFFEQPGWYAKGVYVSGDRAYVTAGREGVWMLDVSDPSQPMDLAASMDWLRWESTDYQSVAVSGSYGYVADYNYGLRVVDWTEQPVQATACDTLGNCTIVTATLAQAQGVQSLALPAGVGVSLLGLPRVLDNLNPVSLGGQAYAITTSLRTLTVTVDGIAIYTATWGIGAVTETLWSTVWTPAGEGPHPIQALASGWDGSTARDAITVTVDLLPPAIGIAPTVITTSHFYHPQSIDLTGWVSDTGSVPAIQVRLEPVGLILEALLEDDSGTVPIFSTWHASWDLGSTALPDGASYTVTVQATDLAGHVATDSQVVIVDMAAPAAVTLTMNSAGLPLAPRDTLRALSPTLTLSWTASHDGSGLGDYLVDWTVQMTGTVATTRTSHDPMGPLSSSYVAGDGQKVAVQLASQDSYGQQAWQRWGIVYVDSPHTPDYMLLDDPDGVYRSWMESGCTLAGVDRRVARSAPTGAALHDEQRLYATWNAEALRLAWTGANWSAMGDLFLYFDVRAGGSFTAWSPYSATITSTVIYMPGAMPPPAADAMAADYLVWVRDEGTALVLEWDGSTWVYRATLAAGQYQFDAALGGGQTDLYLPFSLIGIDNPAATALDLVALASEENTLRLWAVLPAANPVNSTRAGAPVPAVQAQQFALTQRYRWDSLGRGACPNGSDGGVATPFQDSDLQVWMRAEPAGAAYSLLNDNLFWLQRLLLGDPPPDVTSFFNFMNTAQSPLGDGRAITYTIGVRNRGTFTATDVVAALSATYALRLTPGDTYRLVALGDVAPGAEITATVNAVVDRAMSLEPWAAVTARVHDAAHGLAGPPLEWLWVQHKVDAEGPAFFGLEQPGYWIGTGLTDLAGYAYDDVGVSTVLVDLQTPDAGATTLNCPLEWPDSGNWSCPWDVTASNGGVVPANGAVFQLRLQASDTLGQTGAWSDTLPFVVDRRPPTITLDLQATQVLSGSVTRDSAFSLVGYAFDEGGVQRVSVCVDGNCGSAGLQWGPGQSTVTYEDVPAAPIPIGAGSACGVTEIVRTFTVTEDWSIAEVSLGFAAEHARRDDLQVELRSPAGTLVQVITDDGVSGTHFRNYNVLLSDAAPSALAGTSGDHDLVGSPYGFLARPMQPLRTFQGESAAGEWTLSICDLNPAANDGAYQRSRLVLVPRDTAAQSGRWTYESPGTGPLDYVPQTISIYGRDTLGNRTADPLSMVVWVDNVPPVLTVSGAISQTWLGPTRTVLSGTVTDGGPTADVSVRVLTPRGEFYSRGAARDGDRWWFDLQLACLGDYTLWVSASDQAGNATSLGPFTVKVLPPSQIYLPLLMKQWPPLPPDMFLIYLPLVIK